MNNNLNDKQDIDSGYDAEPEISPRKHVKLRANRLRKLQLTRHKLATYLAAIAVYGVLLVKYIVMKFKKK
jgi:hypothetical protein